MSILKRNHLHTLPGRDDITRTTLANGITILVRSNPVSPSVVLSGYFPAGGLFDPREKLGLAHFTAATLMRGARKRSFQQIYDDLETAGASLGFGASIHNVNFGGRALVEDLPLLLDVLADCLKNPIFPLEQVERLRAQYLTGLAIRAQDTAEMASLTFDEILFAGHPYSLPEEGYPETIQRISRDDLAAFQEAHYSPEGMVVVVVGAVTPDQAIELVAHSLGQWNPAKKEIKPTLPSIQPPDEVTRKHVFIPGKKQTDLVMGMIGPRRNADNYLAASLGNNILGQFGMMGRIGLSVREKAGLAYYASTSLNAWIDSGSWEVSAGVDPNNVQRAIDLILDEIHRFTNEPVSVDELRDSQSNYIGRLPLSLESNSGVANALLNIERFQLGLDYYREYPEQVNQVTPEQILDTARYYLDTSRFVIVSAGPESE
jgi:zinc protease